MPGIVGLDATEELPTLLFWLHEHDPAVAW